MLPIFLVNPNHISYMRNSKDMRKYLSDDCVGKNKKKLLTPSLSDTKSVAVHLSKQHHSTNDIQYLNHIKMDIMSKSNCKKNTFYHDKNVKKLSCEKDFFNVLKSNIVLNFSCGDTIQDLKNNNFTSKIVLPVVDNARKTFDAIQKKYKILKYFINSKNCIKNIFNYIHNVCFTTKKNKMVFYDNLSNDIIITKNKNTLKNYPDKDIDPDNKDFNWVPLYETNILKSTNILADNIFNNFQTKQDINELNKNFSNTLIPFLITVNGERLSQNCQNNIFNELKKYFSNSEVRNLITVCLNTMMNNQPCSDIFYNIIKISKLLPEPSLIRYSINYIDDHTAQVIVTYLGSLNKMNEYTGMNYTQFGIRASIMLFTNKTPIINYYHFIK